MKKGAKAARPAVSECATGSAIRSGLSVTLPRVQIGAAVTHAVQEMYVETPGMLSINVAKLFCA